MIKVLIVDDSALVRKLFGAVLANEPDFDVATARNGTEALQLLESFRPDVVTLDVHMPGMDGLECLDRIMLERPCSVVMVSSLTAEGADATLDALRLGAVDFVPKPAGAVSLHMAAFAPTLVEKIRAAATAKPRASRRLRERLQHRSGVSATRPRRPRPAAAISRTTSVEAIPGIVVVGVSTGGPPALDSLLSSLPAHFPWPILIAQHMPASFTGPLARRLDGICAIRVLEVLRPTPLEPGYAYIGRGDADLIVSRRLARIVAMSAPSQADYPWHPSTDRLVRSAMEHMAPPRIIGVLLTGMGDDGAAAMVRLRAEGGRTIAESEETAVIWGMPGALVKAGGADWIEPLPKIAGLLEKITLPHAAYP